MSKKLMYIIVRVIFIILIFLCLCSRVSAAMALLFGILYSLILGNPYLDFTRKFSQRLLQFSVVGLGAGMNLIVVGREGLAGMTYTMVGIILTMLLGLLIGRLLKTNLQASLLVTVGTAICGGSAIAAVAPVIQAKGHEISVALVTVFVLNAIALVVFPALGHYFNLTQTQFGYWSALAIHDTSSVVGAAMQYGSHAVDVATTVKLVRALWIAPVALVIGYVWNLKSKTDEIIKPRFPLFIIGFIIAAALVTWIPALQSTGLIVSDFAKRTLVLTLFLIGSTFARSTLKSVGIKPFVQGIILWVVMAAMTLAAVMSGYLGINYPNIP